eukprot:6175677-Pleurochrysis_carterae.AAC.6
MGAQERAGDVCLYEPPGVGRLALLRRVRLTNGVGLGTGFAPLVRTVRLRGLGRHRPWCSDRHGGA